MIRKYLNENGYEGIPAKIIASPFLRTLQTAAYLQFGLTGESTETEIITNDGLCVKLASSLKSDPLT